MNSLTLVAYYGQKKDPLLRLIDSCLQSINESSIGGYFIPYTHNQIHATIIGLEWFVDAGIIVNQYYFKLTGKKESIMSDTFPEVIDEAFPISIRYGGFSPDYTSFRSLGKIPYERSFQIHRSSNKVILIGWPNINGDFRKKSLADLRSSIETKCKIAHKYRDDNDLYFVLGEIKKPVKIDATGFEQLLIRAEKSIRKLLSAESVNITLHKENLSLVSYSTEDLNEMTSIVFPFETHSKNLSQLIKQLQMSV
jgi:hypothetical protein